MRSTHIENATLRISGQAHEPLFVRKERGGTCMVSEWRLSATEITDLLMGGTVHLTVISDHHPIVELSVKEYEHA